MQALAAFDQAGRLLSSLGRDKTARATGLFNGWGLKLEQMGQPLEAERMYGRAIDNTRLNEKDEAVSPILLNNYARSLRELGQLKKATQYAERAYRGAQAVQQRAPLAGKARSGIEWIQIRGPATTKPSGAGSPGHARSHTAGRRRIKSLVSLVAFSETFSMFVSRGEIC